MCSTCSSTSCSRGHTRPIRAAVFTAENTIVTISDDATVRVWDTETGASTMRIVAGSIALTSLAASWTHGHYAHGSSEGTVNCNSSSSHSTACTVSVGGGVAGLAYMWDGLLAVACRGGRLYEVDCGTGAIVGQAAIEPSEEVVRMAAALYPLLALPPLVV